MTQGISRDEFEYPIPHTDALEIFRTLAKKPYIEKQRFMVRHDLHIWEIDVLSGDNAGLVLAEIELSRTDEVFAHPSWLGAEVSVDPRYRNAALAEYPYQRWLVVAAGR